MAHRSEQGQNNEPRVAVTTVATAAEADHLARTLVDRGLAACVSVFPEVSSTYRWEGRIETESECLLWIKTTSGALLDLEREMAALHSYDVPEFLVLNVEHASPSYLGWLRASTGPTVSREPPTDEGHDSSEDPRVAGSSREEQRGDRT